MSYILDVKWLSGCSEVGDQEVYSFNMLYIEKKYK